MREDDIKRAEEGLDDPDRKVEEFNGYSFGERVRIIHDNEDAGYFEGTEGVIVLEKVGAEEYGNVRTHFGFLEDDMDGAVEIRDLDDIEAV